MNYRTKETDIAAACMIGALVVLTSFATAQPATLGPDSHKSNSPFELPSESITITATKPSDATIKAYVETRSVQTQVAGRMARWTNGVCPLTVGLRDTYTTYISKRIREIANAVGAPVNGNQSCRPNIEVLFTMNPQVLMDNVRQKQPYYLGYYNSPGQADQLAKVTHPIQAWYVTTTIDMDGAQQADDGACHGNRGIQFTSIVPPPPGGGGMETVTLVMPCAITVHAAGSRISDGLSSGFFHVLIVADPAKLPDYEIGALGDYIALMALSQAASLDSCQELPSISNLLAKGCAAKTNWITDGDLAYLRALYSMPSGSTLGTQYNELQYQMKKFW